jgi:membrane associated rhomboid family serine protease
MGCPKPRLVLGAFLDNPARTNSMGTEMETRRHRRIGQRWALLAVLEFVVGGIVVLGGAALVYFSIDSAGMSLGISHAILGLMGFPTGYLLLTGSARARTLTLGVDAGVIAFSIASEVILSTTSSLRSGRFDDSVIGTALAVLIAAVIMYQLMRARPPLSAGRPSSVR